MITQSPILVTGMARSGTSMIAGVINLCGAFSGEVSVNNSNKRGMYENIRIREEIVKPYLDRIGADKDGQYPLPAGRSIPMDWRDKVEKIMIEQGYTSGNWMYKDSRNGLIWPIWNSAFPEAKWVLVRRRTGDIVESCTKTGFMKAFKDPAIQKAVGVSSEKEGWLWWVHEQEKNFVDMITEGVNVKVIWPERMIHGNYQQIYELLDWLGLEWKSEALTFIDSLLWGSRKKGGK